LSKIISELKSVGLTNTDIHNLEWLEDREVLEKLPGGFRWLRKNLREDTIIYFETFAALLESRLPEKAMSNTTSSDLLADSLPLTKVEQSFASSFQ